MRHFQHRAAPHASIGISHPGPNASANAARTCAAANHEVHVAALKQSDDLNLVLGTRAMSGNSVLFVPITAGMPAIIQHDRSSSVAEEQYF